MKEYIERTALGIGRCNPDVFEDKGYAKGRNAAIDIIQNAHAADVREVVTCGECKWWTKQETSLQGRCELSGGYPTAAWFCANGQKEG